MTRSLVVASAVVLALFMVLRVEAVINGGACVKNDDCVKNAFCWNKFCNCGYGYGTSADKTQCDKLADTCGKDADCKGAGTCKVHGTDSVKLCSCPPGWTGSRCEARIVTGTLERGVELEKAQISAPPPVPP
ncbi:delta-like protein C [Crassostrea angulata]|uniref:delta-like protein C n=1 Tax=Magallana angulata TaxID=2784310 RepID=UPI0022B1657C|nr:delta-like protein C [Crassostrea angulata]